ncbi:uncharacterized protein B0T15DRAFT_574978 [Chaetomium strumarium]|uniref:NmrA-like domain-containing protein n=1 Tax=Chaetomium strumarium TaxID=1170767 RepID=A0AAJ0GTR1_9PEZI|nr:hypothetical protein B0T15DRAFT_574978 [Chaetomium strumarium]
MATNSTLKKVALFGLNGQVCTGYKSRQGRRQLSQDEILDVFKGHDAVVLSLNYMAEMQHHNMLVDASLEAGVKRLIPSIWGGRLDLPEALEIFPIAASKGALLDYVKSKALPAPGWSYTAVACGLFHDLCVLTNFYGFDAEVHTATI